MYVCIYVSMYVSMYVCMFNTTIFQVLLLDWRPLSRDAFFYGISIVMFSAFAWDGTSGIDQSTIILKFKHWLWF